MTSVDVVPRFFGTHLDVEECTKDKVATYHAFIVRTKMLALGNLFKAGRKAFENVALFSGDLTGLTTAPVAASTIRRNTKKNFLAAGVSL